MYKQEEGEYTQGVKAREKNSTSLKLDRRTGISERRVRGGVLNSPEIRKEEKKIG